MVGKGKREQKIAIEAVIVAAITVAGLALQVITGGFNREILAFPANLILITAIPVLLILFKGALKHLASGSLSIILISTVTIIALYMGLVPGNSAKSSWPFALIYLALLINLTASVIIRIRTFKFRKDISFMLNHIGLLILLFSAGPGSADKARYFMRVFEGKVEWRAEKSGGKERAEAVELPVAISLEDFEMDEYPPKLAIIERNTGIALPEKRPIYFEAILNAVSTIERWNLVIDSVLYKPGFAPAAFVRVTDKYSGEATEGWVSCGNYFQHFKTLSLDSTYCVAMTFPEPKEYRSIVEVYTQSGKVKNGVVRVNHPMTIGGWKIYQHSYDSARGRDSVWSLFELVYDPWIIPAYIGMIMMIFGAITLFWKGGKS
jgi:hypothetical protein